MALPGGLTTITVSGTYTDTLGNPLPGSIAFLPTVQLIVPGTQIMYARAVTAQLNASGHFSVTLICTDNSEIIPAGWYYEVTENISGGRTYPVYAPSTLGSTADISDLIPVPTYQGMPAIVPSGQVAPGYGSLSGSNTWTGTNTFTGTVTGAGSGGGSSGALLIANNLSDLQSVTAARTNLGLGAAALMSVGTTSGTVASGADSRITGALQAANNLSEVSSPTTARTNLGLGNSATLNVGTATATVAAGNDARITGALQSANNLSDLGSVSTARSVLGLGSAALLSSASVLQSANNLSDVNSSSTARTNLGLGGAAVLNVGTSSGTVAAGNDARFAAALQVANNLSDLNSASTARGNLGLGSAALLASSAVVQVANNLSDVTASTARTNLGLGGSAVLNVGTSTGTVAAGDDSRITGAIQSSTVTTKGDLLAASAASTLSRLSVGADGTLLVAASGQTLGVQWRTLQISDIPTLNQSTTGNAATATTASNSLAIGGITVTGTPSVNNVITAVSATAATWQPSGSAPVTTVFGRTGAVAAATNDYSFSQISGTASAGQLPAATNSTQGAVVLDGTAGDIQPLGTQTAGAVGKAADAGHIHSTSGVCTTFNPSATRWGLKSETVPLYSCNLSATMTSGTLFLTLLPWFANVQISKLSCYVTSAGVTLSGTNQLALYSSSGTLLSTTGDMTAGFGSTGWQEGTLATPQTPTVDTVYYVGVLTHATTAVKIFGFNMTATVGVVNGVYPTIDFATQTNHATFTPSSGTLNSGAYWFGAR